LGTVCHHDEIGLSVRVEISNCHACSKSLALQKCALCHSLKVTLSISEKHLVVLHHVSNHQVGESIVIQVGGKNPMCKVTQSSRF
jgi:hypothetical protein